jgi:hypothetical protein
LFVEIDADGERANGSVMVSHPDAGSIVISLCLPVAMDSLQEIPAMTRKLEPEQIVTQ